MWIGPSEIIYRRKNRRTKRSVTLRHYREYHSKAHWRDWYWAACEHMGDWRQAHKTAAIKRMSKPWLWCETCAGLLVRTHAGRHLTNPADML